VAAAGEGPPELGAHQGQRVLDAVAVRVECCRLETVLRPSKQQLDLHRPVEALPQQSQTIISVDVFLSGDQATGVEEYSTCAKWLQQVFLNLDYSDCLIFISTLYLFNWSAASLATLPLFFLFLSKNSLASFPVKGFSVFFS
jgi:hypothetical protein